MKHPYVRVASLISVIVGADKSFCLSHSGDLILCRFGDAAVFHLNDGVPPLLFAR